MTAYSKYVRSFDLFLVCHLPMPILAERQNAYMKDMKTVAKGKKNIKIHGANLTRYKVNK